MQKLGCAPGAVAVLGAGYPHAAAQAAGLGLQMILAVFHGLGASCTTSPASCKVPPVG